MIVLCAHINIRGGSRTRETGVRPASARRALMFACIGRLGACPPRNILDFRPSEIVAGAIWGRNTRPPHLLHPPCLRS